MPAYTSAFFSRSLIYHPFSRPQPHLPRQFTYLLRTNKQDTRIIVADGTPPWGDIGFQSPLYYCHESSLSSHGESYRNGARC